MIGCNCSISHTLEGTLLVISVEGEIDHHSAALLRRRADDLIWQRKPDTVILDMSGVGFMDSSGLGFIMGRYTEAQRLGIPFSVGNPSPPVLRMLKLCGFDKRLNIVNRKGASKK